MAMRVRYLFAIVMLVQFGVLAVYLMRREPSTDDTAASIMYNGSSTRPHTSVVDTRRMEIADKRTPEAPPDEKSEVFQPIDGKQAWLYSAFYDHVAAQNGKPLVRVFGVIRRSFIVKVFCNFSSPGTNLTSTGVVTEFPGHFGLLDRPAFLECSLPTNARPTHVSVSFQATERPTNRLQILYPGPRIRNFTVCYSVLHSGYNRASQLIDSIEMNRLLGAEHFMVYNYSISPEVGQILRRYQDDGLVTVLQWPIPTLESHYYSQLTSLNDCSYRNRNTSRFVVVVDTDEVIVPTSHLNWMDFINSVSPQEMDVSQFIKSPQPPQKGKAVTGCFMVRSSYFPIKPTPNWDSLPVQLPFGEDEKKNIIKYNILSLSQLGRQNYVFPFHDRCKYIARPEFVYISGIHWVMAFTNSQNCLGVNENMALVHHYRDLSVPAKDMVNNTSILKFKQSLYPQVMKQIQRFPNIFK